jgi:hypothetical protein
MIVSNKCRRMYEALMPNMCITYLQPKNIDYIPHNNVDKNWFEDYFGFNELNEIDEYLPKIKESLNYNFIKYGDYLKNINFTINNTKFEVGDFGILSFSELKNTSNNIRS